MFGYSELKLLATSGGENYELFEFLGRLFSFETQVLLSA
jgi:hypothetical protein